MLVLVGPGGGPPIYIRGLVLISKNIYILSEFIKCDLLLLKEYVPVFASKEKRQKGIQEHNETKLK